MLAQFFNTITCEFAVVWCCLAGLSHCRHLKTVRTHLSGLVHSATVSVDSPTDATTGLSADTWRMMKESGLVRDNSY